MPDVVEEKVVSQVEEKDADLDEDEFMEREPEPEGEDEADVADEGDSRDEDKDKDEAEANVKSEDDDSGYTPELLERAAQSNLSEEEVRALGSPEVVKRYLAVFDKKIATLGQAEVERFQSASSGEVAAVPADTNKSAGDEIVKNADGTFALSEEFKNAYEGEAIVDEMTSVVGLLNGYEGKFAEMKNVLGRLQLAEQKREDEAFDRDVDVFVGGLGEEWKDVFGGKKFSDMTDKERRGQEGYSKFLNSLLVIAAGRAKAGLKELSFKAMADQAIGMAFTDKQARIARKQISTKLKGKSTQFTARPGKHEGRPSVRGKQGALRSIRDILKRSRDEEEDTDGLPE